MTGYQDVLDTIAAAPPVPAPLRPAILRTRDDLPFVDLGDGSHLQLLQVDLAQGLWVVRMQFDPGCTIDRHYHTGPVFAFTLSGRWRYKEYPDAINQPGSYLFEPAGSVHTLETAPGSSEPAHVWFAVHGANVNLDADGQVKTVLDAASVLNAYRALCEASGQSSQNVIVFGG